MSAGDMGGGLSRRDLLVVREALDEVLRLARWLERSSPPASSRLQVPGGVSCGELEELRQRVESLRTRAPGWGIALAPVAPEEHQEERRG